MIFCLDLYDFSRQTWETPLHYCARAGNEDILLEIVKHIGALGVQKAVNKQSKVNSQTHWCIRCTNVQKAVNKQPKVNSQPHWCIRCTEGS